jgi:hypothetical protein
MKNVGVPETSLSAGRVYVGDDPLLPGPAAHIAGELVGVQAQLGGVPDEVLAVSASW